MLHDVRILHDTVLQSSHRGHPEVVSKEYSGGRGRPKIVINHDFLAWAYRLRSTSGIADFLGVSHTIVRQALLDYNIVQPGVNPFPVDMAEHSSQLDLPEFILGSSQDHLPEFIQGSSRDHDTATVFQSSSLPGYLSIITNPELDTELLTLRQEYPRAGISILDGMLRNHGHIVQRERIRQSLLRIDPVERIFDRVRLRRRGYKVPGPNSLWHHDGQHGKLPVDSSMLGLIFSYRSDTLGYCYTRLH